MTLLFRQTSCRGGKRDQFLAENAVLYFDQVSLCTHNFSLESAMELKLVPFCSPRDALSDGIIVCQNRLDQFLAENTGQ